MRKRSLQLLLQRPPPIHPPQLRLTFPTPINAPMLLPRAANPPYPAEIKSRFPQAREEDVESAQPERDGGVDFMVGVVGEDAGFDAETIGVGVEVVDGGVDDFEVGGYG